MAAKNRTLFIIDDDVTNNELLKKFLGEKLDCNIISFSTAEEAIRNVHMHPYIVLVDYNMSRISATTMNGMEITKQFLHNNSRTFIIILTVQDKIEVVKDVFKYGGYDCVVKNPQGFVRLEQMIKNINKTLRYKGLMKTYRKLFFFLLSIVIVAILLFILYMRTNSPTK
jgi:DNA-binding NarL/FixJ family response regulator